MIQCDLALARLLRVGLIRDPDYSLINPASIDVRIGQTVMRETIDGMAKCEIPKVGLVVDPGEFLLTETQEFFDVPNGYAVELRLKSTTARQGWNHAMAVWVDPGFKGKLTLEIKNDLRYSKLTLMSGARFAQAIVHKLSGMSGKPYGGRYQNAQGVEGPKG